MTRPTTLIALCLAAAAAPALADDVALGERYLQEVIRADDPFTLRYRYVVPALGEVAPQTALDAMERICNEEIAPLLSEEQKKAQIVVSLAEAETVFGERDPAVRQQFEAFSVEGERCIWEFF